MKSSGDRIGSASRALVRGIAGMLLAVGAAQAADYVWNGAGITGGTDDVDWGAATNWLVGGSVPTLPPGALDDVAVAFNATNDTPAVVVPDGAVVRHVTLSGTTTLKTDNRYLLFAGDAEFATLDYLGATKTFAWSIPDGFTLTLSGGDATKPTFKHLAETSISSYTTVFGDGWVTITADPAYIKLGGALPSSYPDRIFSMVGARFRFATSGQLDFNNRLLGVATGGSLVFDAAPIVANPPPYLRLRGGLFQGNPAAPLGLDDTMGWLPDRTDSGFLGDVRLKALVVSSHTSNSGKQNLDAVGDLVISGQTIHNPGSYGHMVTGAVYISRLERITGSSVDYSRIRMLGYDLEVTSAAPVIVGDAVTNGIGYSLTWPRSMLDLRGLEGRASTLSVPGDVWVGFNGNIAGDAATQIRIGGDFHNRVFRNYHLAGGQDTGFDLAQSQVAMNGARHIRAPQLLEVHGEDLGATTAGQIASNLALGSLVVGSPTQVTHARLMDRDDFKADVLPDALYVGALTIHAGSTLDLCGLNLYVAGQKVTTRSTGYGDGDVIDSTIPSGTVIVIH